jgi:hypothetical protein
MIRTCSVICWGIVFLGCSKEGSYSTPIAASDLGSVTQTDSAETLQSSEPITIPKFASVEAFIALMSNDPAMIQSGLQEIEQNWHPGQRAMILEIQRFFRGTPLATQLLSTLEQHSRSRHGDNAIAWDREVWNSKYQPHPNYAEFKSRLYSRIDPRFAEYFTAADQATIRLDEIRWGGVLRDGIPPLKDPVMLKAGEASYLADSDVVFGIAVGDDARAYPKRILAWHEMVKDVVGGLSLNGVYCTLCGSMIAYKTEFQGRHYELGTSGFLYRSNKLMYDHDTKSLWSTITGEPCVGSLVGKGIRLEPYHVVTTTWGAWRRRHPQTLVLSLKTGHRRNYGEGVAYHDYFATDELMFDVPRRDERLANKAEVFIVRDLEHVAAPLAISQAFLSDHPVYHEVSGPKPFVVITDSTGANRAYSTGDVIFRTLQDDQVVDESGERWKLSEFQLLHSATQRTCPRLPAHRAFWFGWYAAHPDTQLVQ